MIFANILAGGIGSRMCTEVPKQFIKLNQKEIICYSLDIFLSIDSIEKVVISINEKWRDYLIELINNRYNKYKDKILICLGGNLRNDSIINAIKSISEHYSLDDNDILITHDAARPFITVDMINEHITAMKESSCVVSAVKTVDTILREENGYIKEVLSRDDMYNIQTPQSINPIIFVKEYEKLSLNDKVHLTDASKVFVNAGYKVKIVIGDLKNIKITTKIDLDFANEILKNYI